MMKSEAVTGNGTIRTGRNKTDRKSAQNGVRGGDYLNLGLYAFMGLGMEVI